MKQGYNTQFAETAFADSLLFRNPANEIFQNVYASSSSRPSAVNVGNKLLTSFGAEFLNQVLPLMKKVYFEREEIIYKCGDKVQFLYFPETAVFSEYQILEDGKTVEVAITGREGLLGTTSIFNSGTALNWSQALIAGKAYKIDIDIFRKYFDNCPDIKRVVFEFLNSYINQLSQRAICYSHHTLPGRLCSWILMIRDRCQSEKFLLTQERISLFLGTQRPSVTTAMTALKRKEMISYTRGRISIRDHQQLESTSCSCYQATRVI